MDSERLNREELRRAYERVRRLPFPSPEPEHALDEDEADQLDLIHAELAQHRGAVAGPVLSLLDGRVPKSAPRRNEPLRKRIERLIERGSVQAAVEGKQHARYLDALDELADRAASRTAPGSPV